MGKHINLAGQRFGLLVAVSLAPKRGTRTYWSCRCDCGAELEIEAGTLKGQKSCGCQRGLARRDLIEETGKRYGRLVVLSNERDEAGKPRLLCRCECGKVKRIALSSLRKGVTQSCGCLSVEMAVERTRTHGQTRTRLYNVWNGMINRCENPNEPKYARYGQRGIKVCPAWRNSFEAFAQDMGEPPSPKHSIDRVNNDGGYESDNCRWATPLEQGNNREVCRKVEYEGGAYPSMSSLARAVGVGYKCLYQMYNARKLPIDQAVARAVELRDKKAGKAMP